MKISVLVLMLACSGAFCQETAFKTAEEYAAYASKAYADTGLSVSEREETARKVAEGADAWQDNYDLQWLAAQALFAWGDTLYHQYQVQNLQDAEAQKKVKNAGDVLNYSQALAPPQGSKLLEIGRQARVCADRAVRLKPDGVEGRYYAALGIALYAYGKSIVSALLEGLGPKFEEHLNKAIAVDPGYQRGASFAALGRYFYKLPWPKKNDRKSLELLKKAEQYDPQSIVTLNYLGDTALSMGKRDEAAQYWERCLKSPDETFNSSLIRQLVEAKLKYGAAGAGAR